MAQVRARQNQSRLRATQPYREGLEAVLASACAMAPIDHPLMRAPAAVRDVAVVVVASNRGLCGGFNAQVLAVAEAFLRTLAAAGRPAHLVAVGRKAISRFGALGVTPAWSTAAFDDRPSPAGVAPLADLLIEGFLSRRYESVVVVSVRYLTVGEQRVRATELLPLARAATGSPAARVRRDAAREHLVEGQLSDITERLVPAVVRARLLGLLLESATSEQIARRLAMAAATDAADEMITHYRRAYYRARQSAITLELMDVIGGASAVSGEGSA
jgi:F-type H+-transporting ATPase subunit gamma